jgi:hypothetical protein
MRSILYTGPGQPVTPPNPPNPNPQPPLVTCTNVVSPASILREILIQAEVVLPDGIPQQPNDLTVMSFVGSMPDSPDQVLVVYDEPGRFFWRNQRGNSRVHPGVQMKFRALSGDGWSVFNCIVQFLDTLGPQVVTVYNIPYNVQSVYRTSGIMFLGEEIDRKRQLWSVNVRMAFQANQVPSMG